LGARAVAPFSPCGSLTATSITRVGRTSPPGTAVASAKAAEGDAKTNRRRRKILMCARQLVSIRFALSIELRSLFHFAQCAQDEETNESDPARYDIAIDPNGDTD